VQIRHGSNSSFGAVPPASEGLATVELFEGERELLDDFLSRLQSIIQRPPASPPRPPDDTQPARFPRKKARS
jgi:hypothetical protein